MWNISYSSEGLHPVTSELKYWSVSEKNMTETVERGDGLRLHGPWKLIVVDRIMNSLLQQKILLDYIWTSVHGVA